MKLCTCPHCGRDIEKVRKPKRQPLVSRPPSRPNARSRMWTSMRIERVFSAQSIAATAEAEVGSARAYIVALVEAGYARVDRESTFEVGDFTTYALLKNTGPHAPRLRSGGKAIFDPNTKLEVPRVRAQ